MKSNFKSSKPTEEKYERRAAGGKSAKGFSSTPKSTEIIQVVKLMIEDDYKDLIEKKGSKYILLILQEMLSQKYVKRFEPTTPQVKNAVRKCVVSFIAKISRVDENNKSLLGRMLDTGKMEEKSVEQLKLELEKLKAIQKAMALKSKTGIDKLITIYVQEMKARGLEIEDKESINNPVETKKSKKNKKKEPVEVIESISDVPEFEPDAEAESISDVPEFEPDAEIENTPDITEFIQEEPEPALDIPESIQEEIIEKIKQAKSDGRSNRSANTDVKKKAERFREYTIEEKAEEVRYFEMVRDFTQGFEFLSEDEISYYAKNGGTCPSKFDSFERYSRFQELRYIINKRMSAMKISEIDAIQIEMDNKCSLLGVADKKILEYRKKVIQKELAREER